MARLHLHLRKLAAHHNDHALEAHQLYEYLQESVNGLRTVIQGVVPVQANENGLMIGLENLTKNIQDLYGVNSSFSYEVPILLKDLELTTQLFYIAQEAVTNAAKHSGASNIEMSLVRTDGHVALTIHDDGQGFDTQALHSTSQGMGLRLMAYRSRLIHVDLDVTSNPGQGTTVTCAFLPN